jgi:hypothetical protein
MEEQELRTPLDANLPAEAVTPPSARTTGFVLAAAALALAWMAHAKPPLAVAFLAISAVLAILSLAAPALLQPLARGWFRLGMMMHTVVNPVVMLALFAVAIVPVGLVMRLFRDPLRLARDDRAVSYWHRADRGGGAPPSMKNQF